MSKSINILDKDYLQWIKELSSRYRRSQIKASVKVNQEMLQFYWELGRDIVEKKAESRWGSGFMKNLSRDLKEINPDATCFSETNLLYMKNFYILYQPYLEITPQVVEQRKMQLLHKLWSKFAMTYFLLVGVIIVLSLISLKNSPKRLCSSSTRQLRMDGAGICCLTSWALTSMNVKERL